MFDAAAIKIRHWPRSWASRTHSIRITALCKIFQCYFLAICRFLKNRFLVRFPKQMSLCTFSLLHHSQILSVAYLLWFRCRNKEGIQLWMLEEGEAQRAALTWLCRVQTASVSNSKTRREDNGSWVDTLELCSSNSDLIHCSNQATRSIK